MTNKTQAVQDKTVIATVAASVDETVLMAKMEKLFEAEKITKQVLGELSRELLAHAIFNKTAVLVNRLVTSSNLTKPNRKFAEMYFKALMPFSSEKVGEGASEMTTFTSFSTKKFNNKAAQCYHEKITTWLDNPVNNIWLWVANNVTIEPREIDYSKRTEIAIKRAIEDGGLNSLQIMQAVLDGGVNPAEIADFVLASIQPTETEAANEETEKEVVNA